METVAATSGDVTDLLKKHGFIIYVKEEKGFCKITFPATFESPGFLGLYKANEKGVAYNLNGSEFKFTEAPVAAQRIYIDFDIRNFANMIGIDEDLICYQNGAGEEVPDIDGVFAEESTKEQSILKSIFNSAKNDGFPASYVDLAQEHGVLEAYNFLIEEFLNA